METPEITRASLRDILYVLFKRKTQIVLFFLVVVVVVAVATFKMKPTYEATSQILVKVGRENLYVPTVPTTGSQSPIINLNREEQINSEIEILKGQNLLEETAQSLGPTNIYEDLKPSNKEKQGILAGMKPNQKAEPLSPLQQSVLRLQNGLSVESIKKSNVIEMKLQHKDPQVAAAVLNRLVELYMDHHLEVHRTPQSFKFFQEQSKILMTKLGEAENRYEAFKRQHNVTALDEEISLLISHEGILRKELNNAMSQIAETENRIFQVKQQLASTPKTVPQTSEFEHSLFVINTLQGRLVELELKEKELLTKYTEQNRLVQNVKEEIQIVRTKLAEQEGKQYGKSRSGLNTTYQRLQEELYENQADLKALNAKKTVQGEQLDDYRARLSKLNSIEVELNTLKRQAELDQQNYRLYLTKFEESRISDAMDMEKITNVTQIQPARPPLKPLKPKKMRNMVLAVLLGIFGGLGLALFMEYLDDSLEKPEDAEKVVDLPVFACIPELKKG